MVVVTLGQRDIAVLVAAEDLVHVPAALVKGQTHAACCHALADIPPVDFKPVQRPADQGRVV